MGTFTLIGIYSVLMLGGLTAAAALFVLIGIWLSDASEPEGDA